MAKEGTYKCKPIKRYKQVRFAQLQEMFEKTYGDIREYKSLWVSTYNTYKLNMNKDWGKWSWEIYEYYTHIPNHTRTEWESFIADKELHRAIRQEIHTNCTIHQITKEPCKI